MKKSSVKPTGNRRKISPVFLKKSVNAVESKALGLEVVARISETVHSERDFYGVIGQASNLILELTSFCSIAIFGFDEESVQIDLITHQGLDQENNQLACKLLLSESFTSICMKNRKITNTFGIGEDARIDKPIAEMLEKDGNNCIASVPMLVRGETVGAINLLFTNPRELTVEEEYIIGAIGRSIGLALINARYVSQIEHEIKRRERAEIKLVESNEKLEEEVTRQTEKLNILNHKLQKANERLTEEIQQKHYESITDKLTGLYNTPYFNVRIKAESEHAKRYNHPLSLMFIDLNNFKSINETLGYDEANKIIADIGKVISESIRKVDSAFRYSSKQFAIILPETKDEGCITVSNRLIEKINKSITDTPPKSPASLAISIGIDQIKQDTDYEKLLENAKDAAAKARSDGDNNVVIFSV